MPKKRLPSPRPKRTTGKPRLKSKFEHRFYDELQRLGLHWTYEADTLKYVLDLTYKPDWKVSDNLYVETKGKFDYTERRKILAVKTGNPEKEVRLCFMRNQKLGKGSKMTYGEWCDKHEIKWSVFPKLPI